jgi:hypothetical protein
MPDTVANLALRRKRAHLAGKIEQAEQRIEPLCASLAHLDAVLWLLDATSNPEPLPAIRPATRGTFFRHDEQFRLIFGALREAKGPLRTRSITDYVMLARGLPADDCPCGTVSRIRSASR